MVNPRKNKSNMPEHTKVRCPHCDKKWFVAVEIVDMTYKCYNCHRWYLVNVDENNGLSIKPTSVLQEDED